MSGQFIESNHKAFTCGGTAIAANTRVKLSSGVLAAAGLTDKEIGITTRRIEADAVGDVLLRTANGTTRMIAADSFSAGAAVYTAASGKISDTQGTGAFLIGIALEAATADGDVVEVLRNSHGETAGS